MIRVEHGDMLEVIPQLVAEGIVADAIVTDPPYHLIQASRNGSLRQNDPSKPFGRAEARGGFMGQRWDGGDVAFQPKTWRSMLPIVRPGGFLLCFGSSRTHHRLWTAIEDADFVIQDTIMWLFGEGFPKGHSQLKPAWEPICVAYKPSGRRTLQIEECCVPLANGEDAFERHDEPSQKERYAERGYANKPGRRIGSPLWGGPMKRLSGGPGQEGVVVKRQPPKMNGRWPANVCHDGSDEVMEAFAAFDAPGQCGVVTGNEPSSTTRFIYGDGLNRRASVPRDNGGSPARFFYCGKADAEDRWGNKHPTVKPIELMKWLVPLVTPKGGLVLDSFAGTGTTGVAALATGRNAILIEKEADYIADIRDRLAFYGGHGQHSLVSKNRNRRETQGTLL